MGLMQCYSSFISGHPGKVIIGTVMIVFSLLMLTIWVRPLPSFKDPRVGLEARDTLISSRLNSWRLLNHETSASLNNLSLSSNSPSYEIIHSLYNGPILVTNNNNNEHNHTSQHDTDNTDNQQEPPVIEMSMENLHENKSSPLDILDEGEDDYYSSINSTTNKLANLMHYSLESDQAFCGQLDEGYAQIIVTPTWKQSPYGLLNLSSILSICQLDRRLRLEHSIDDKIVFQRDCERFELQEVLETKDSTPIRYYGSACCNSWSLPNYIACLSNQTSCFSLTTWDIKNFESLLQLCAPYYHRSPIEECFIKQKDALHDTGTQNSNMLNSPNYRLDRLINSKCGMIPEKCLRCGGWTYNVMHYLVNHNFMLNKNESNQLHKQQNTHKYIHSSKHGNTGNHTYLSHTNIFLPIAKSPGIMPYYQAISKHSLKTPFVYAKAMDLGMKNSLFDHLLSEDAKLFLIALLAILIVISIHTWSIILSFVILLIICLSLCSSFVIYELILDIPVFPFMNLLAVVISFGICSDNAMLFCKQWTLEEDLHCDQATISNTNTMNQYNDCSLVHPNDLVITEPQHLNDTIITTTVADTILNSLNSTDLKKDTIDGVLSGNPGCLTKEQAGIDRMLKRAIVGTSIATLATACSFVISAISKITAVRCFCIFATLSVLTNYILIVILLPPTLILDSRLSRKFCHELCHFGPNYVDFLRKAQHARNNMIETGKLINHYILVIVNQFKFYLIISFVTLLCCSSILVFYRPTLQPADDDHVQLLSSKHEFEQYDRNLRRQFAFERHKERSIGHRKSSMITGDALPVRIVFGLDAKDNGDMFDTHDRGTLVFDPNFDLADPKAQSWMLDFCKKLRQQRFIQTSNAGLEWSNCFIETFKSWMESRPCQDPVQTEIDHSPCCQAYEFPFSRSTFNKCVGPAVNIIRKTPQDQPNFNAGVRFFKNSTRVAALVIEYRSNRVFSESFTKMSRFFSDIDEWVSWQINNTAPASLKSGWFISSNLEFLALQTELLNSTIASIILEILFAMVALMLSTRDIITTIAGTVAIGTIITTTVGFLILFRWTLGVAESIMISLTIGLSIDFALHYSVAYNETRRNGSNEAIIHSVLDQVCGPIALATITTSVAGLVVIWSDILAYQELGVFLILIAVNSWITSTFFLMPMLASVNYLSDSSTMHFSPKLITDRILKMVFEKLNQNIGPNH